MFGLAGLLVGGCYSAYQAESKLLTYVAAVLAALCLVAGISMMRGAV